MTFEERLRPIVVAGDVGAAQALLTGLDATERRAAAAWFAKASRWFSEIPYEDFGSHSDIAGLLRTRNEGACVVGLCAVELCGPATAARRIPWGELTEREHLDGIEALVAALSAKDRAWAADFVTAASSARVSEREWKPRIWLSTVIRRVGRHHGLPCPTGRTFYSAFLAGCPEDDVVNALVADPWMPDLLLKFLSFGECGDCPWLSAHLPHVVARGAIDREVLVQHCLGLLTSPQRAGSQAVLAGILKNQEVLDDELPGFEYALGVIATSARPVYAWMLPYAIRLAATPDDVTQLASVVVTRREKAQWEVLLRALTAELLDRFGAEAVGEALRILGGTDDTAFSAKVAKALAAIDVEGLAETPQSVVLGLWDLRPTPLPADERPVWPTPWYGPSWSLVLDRKSPNAHDLPLMASVLVSNALVGLADGAKVDLADLREAFGVTMSFNLLQLPRFTALLPEFFLAGAMRFAWPMALDLADLCAQQPKVQAGLAGLFRTLARFAHEAPPGDLPAGIAALAARTGSTKAQMEARALGAAMSPEGRQP